MRTLIFFFSFSLLTFNTKAEGPYKKYLLAKIYTPERTLQFHYPVSSCEPGNDAGLPRYQIPKGNIFCRMEDKLTKATKVWIKIGVQ